MNLSFKVLIRFLFSILGQTQPKMVYRTGIFLLLLPLLVMCLYCCWFFKRRLVLVQSKPRTILPPYWPASDRRGSHVMEHFTYSLLLSIYFSDTSNIRTAAILPVRQRRLPSNTRHAIPPNWQPSSRDGLGKWSYIFVLFWLWVWWYYLA